MIYCKNCLQPDTRPQTVFSDGGICPACEYFEQERQIDFEERFEDLTEIVETYRTNSPTKFDCILGVSGGKDSTRQALFLREKLHLTPLLVCFAYPPLQLNERGARNISNLIELGFSMEIRAPAPETLRRLSKLAFDNFANWVKATELALVFACPQAALEWEIPLIFWGEHPGSQLGDMGTMGKTFWDGNNLFQLNTIQEGDITWIKDAGFSASQIQPYQTPNSEERRECNFQIVYLGVFWDDWSLLDNGAEAALYGLELREDFPENTGDLYGLTALDEDWTSLNQMIKYYKYGFGRITDYVNEDIRRGRMSREQGIGLAIELDGSCSDSYILDFCAYIGISVDAFWEKVNSATNKRLFKTAKGKRPVPLFEVGVGLPN